MRCKGIAASCKELVLCQIRYFQVPLFVERGARGVKKSLNTHNPSSFGAQSAPHPLTIRGGITIEYFIDKTLATGLSLRPGTDSIPQEEYSAV